MSVTDDVRAEARTGGSPPGAPSQRDGQFDKTPPQDIAAEQCVLGGMLLSKDAIADVVEILKSSDFYRPVHATIFDRILDLYGRGEPADAITVAAALADSGDLGRVGGAPYLHTLIASVPTAANAAYYARIVAERAVLRRLVEAGTRIVQLGYGAAGGGGRDVDDVVDLAQQAVYEVTERRVSEDFAVLADMLQPTLDEIEAVGAQGGVMSGVPTGFTDLDRLLNGLHPGQLIIVAGRPGLGKALALDTPLPTPDGWTSMGQVKVGDRLFGADGKPTTITAAFEVMYNRPCYEIEFSDGSVIVADAEHLWQTTSAASGPRAGVPELATGLSQPLSRGGLTGTLLHAQPAIGVLAVPRRLVRQLPDLAGPRIVSTAELARTARVPDQRPRHAVRNCAPLALPDRELPVPPYALGCWLGGGEPDLRELRAVDQRALRSLTMYGDRHIPQSYLRASQRQRRDLLAGLLDATGAVAPDGVVEVPAATPRLAADLQELIVGLGHVCTITGSGTRDRQGPPSIRYTVRFSTHAEVFHLAGKKSAHGLRSRLAARSADRVRQVVDVRPVASVPVRCVTVDSPDHLYLAGRAMIPTHNSTASMDFARNAAIRHNCASAIFSLEMSKVEIVMRLLSAESRVPLHVLRSGQLSDDDWTKLARRMGEISEAPLFVDDTPNMNLMEIRAKARRLKQRHDLKMIVVDYLQLMSSPKRTESRQQEVAELSRGLKLLAKEVECPVIAVSQLNRGPEQRTDKRPQLSDLRESGCLTADTALLRADTGAPVTFAELLRDGHAGVSVWSLDESRRMVAAPITNVFPSGTKPVYQLTLASGRRVKATSNHRFLSFHGWQALGEFSPGDRIAVPRRIPAPITAGLGWSEYRLGLLAHLIGDGCVLPRQPLHYTSQDEENLSFVEMAAEIEFGITPRRVREGNRQHSYLPAPFRLTHGRSNPIHQWFRELGIDGLRSYEKRLPEELYRADDKEIRLFLRHLWATDGSVFVPKPEAEKSQPRIYYATSSRSLADGVIHLLGRLGIATRVDQVNFQRSERPGYHVTVAGVVDMRRFCEEIGVHGARGEHVAAYLAHSASIRRNTDADTLPVEDDVFWDETLSIEMIGVEPVYDATVQGTHNFIADGIVAHNSIEQDADVVILLHRDDYYDKESPRAGEADFIVAKHRNGPTDTVTVAAQLHLSRFVDMAIV